MSISHRLSSALLVLVAACGGVSEEGDPDGAPPVPDATPGLDGCPTQTWYADCDGDGVAALGGTTLMACTEPAPGACGGGWTTTAPAAGSADCDDTRGDVLPGATEACDGVDNDCDGLVDEDGLTTFYRDSDGDGYGDPSVTLLTCNPPGGYVANGTDCNDGRADVSPGALEVCDAVDNDCDAQVDEGAQSTFFRDADGDGYGNPGVSVQACSAPAGYVANLDDCNDGTATAHPGAPEICDTIDNDCDGQLDEGVQSTFYRDADGDGFGDPSVTTLACSVPAGYTSDSTDCNDSAGTVNPGAAEVCWNGNVDDNCTGIPDDAAECMVQCNWSGARWLSHGWDGGNAFAAGAWVSCAAGQLNYIDSVMPNPPGAGPVSPPPIPIGTGDTQVGCNWGAANRWVSQGIDGTAAFTHGADLSCNGSRVTQMNWEANNIVGPFTSGQLGCDWSGAIYLGHGIDGNCSWFTGLQVTCSANHITNMQWFEAGGCNRHRD